MDIALRTRNVLCGGFYTPYINLHSFIHVMIHWYSGRLLITTRLSCERAKPQVFLFFCFFLAWALLLAGGQVGTKLAMMTFMSVHDVSGWMSVCPMARYSLRECSSSSATITHMTISDAKGDCKNTRNKRLWFRQRNKGAYLRSGKLSRSCSSCLVRR